MEEPPPAPPPPPQQQQQHLGATAGQEGTKPQGKLQEREEASEGLPKPGVEADQ